jgi:hypothetical protein
MSTPKLPIRYHVDYRYKEKNGLHEFHTDRILTKEMLADTIERHVIDVYGRGIDVSQIVILDFYYQEVQE